MHALASWVLLVDDDHALLRLLDGQLRQAGYRTVLATTGVEALAQAERHRPQVVLLDVVLPDHDGVELCRRLKAGPQTRQARVLLLSGRSSEADRVAGFEAGADDYVCKPFSLRELIWRVRALERRGDGAESVRRAGALTIDPAAFFVAVAEEPVPVSKTELALLCLLSEQIGRVFSHGELSYRLWGGLDGPEVERLQRHVRRLKRKLGSAAACLERVGDVGYRLAQATSTTVATADSMATALGRAGARTHK